MHQLIRILVYAKDKEEAATKANEVMNNRLCGDDKPFDYGSTFDSDSATERWGNKEMAYKYDTKRGKKLAEQGIKYHIQEVKRALKEVRRALNKFSDDEIIEEKEIFKNIKEEIVNELQKDKKAENPLAMIRYYFNIVGKYEGSDIYLYDEDGSGLRNFSDLKRITDELKNEKGDLWVVPADVHF